MLNENARALGENRSCIRELFEYGKARAAVVGAEKVYDYSIGNPSIPAPPEVNEAIRAALAEMSPLAVHGYTSAAGDLGARGAIAADLNERFGADARAEELFLTCGAAPALSAVLHALASPEAEVLLLAPYFPEYKPLAEAAGLKVRVVPASCPDFGLPLARIEAAINARTAAIIVNSPNNPSGVVYSEAELRALSALLTRKSAEFRRPVYIISDEPYRELVYGGVTVPFLPLLYRDTVVCYSYSKCLSLPGERIGYVYVPSRCADGAALYAAVAGAARTLGHVCAPSLMQQVIARCARVRPDLAVYARNRALLYDSLTAMGYEAAPPDGAFYLFVKAPNGDAEAFSRMAMRRDLLLVPGGDFGCAAYLRICYCVEEAMIRRSLGAFEALIREAER